MGGRPPRAGRTPTPQAVRFESGSGALFLTWRTLRLIAASAWKPRGGTREPEAGSDIHLPADPLRSTLRAQSPNRSSLPAS